MPEVRPRTSCWERGKELGASQGMPDYTLRQLVNYFENGVPPGDFLYGVLSNDLKKACYHADDRNQLSLWIIVMWCIEYAPVDAWGSAEIAAEVEV